MPSPTDAYACIDRILYIHHCRYRIFLPFYLCIRVVKHYVIKKYKKIDKIRMASSYEEAYNPMYDAEDADEFEASPSINSFRKASMSNISELPSSTASRPRVNTAGSLHEVKKGLDAVYTYHTKKIAERHTKTDVMVLEVTSTGASEMKCITLRDLLSYVINHADGKSSSTSHTDGEGKRDMVSNLQQRDLRRLDFAHNVCEEPILIVRKHAVLIALDPLRAIIMSDRIILIVPDGADTLIQLLQEHMKAWIADSNQSNGNGSSSSNSIDEYVPFEIHAYEAIIATVYAIHSQEYDGVSARIASILLNFKSVAIVSIDIQEKMRLLKNHVMEKIGHISSIRRAINEILNNDDDMALMNLTQMRKNPSLYIAPLDQSVMASHEIIEVLFESYLADWNSLETKLTQLRQQIQNAEELVSLRLDTSRNQLLIADTIISVISCCLSFGSFVGAIFGTFLYICHTHINYPSPTVLI